MMASLTEAVSVQCAPRGLILEAQSTQDPLLLLPARVGNHSLLQSVQGGFLWWWGLSFVVLSARWTPRCLVLLALHCGFFFFSTCSCAVPQAEISPVLSLNALAEFWRRYLAERRETLSLQGLRVSARWGIQPSWCSSVHFLSSSLLVILLIWKGLFVNHLPFLPSSPEILYLNSYISHTWSYMFFIVWKALS